MSVFLSAFSQEKNTISEKELFKHISTQDSGFLLKKEVWQISAIVNIIDSVKKIEEDYEREEIEDGYKKGEYTKEEVVKYLKYIEEQKEESLKREEKEKNDTIAKYYKKNNGNYIFAIQYDFWGYYYGSNILIEFSPKGEMIKNEIYYHCYYGSPCGNFNKLGDFFNLETYTCGYGGTFDISLFLFKEIAIEDSLNRIPFLCWLSALFFDDEQMDDDKYKDMTCYGAIKKTENDSLIISYEQKYNIFVRIGKGRDIKSELLETIEGDTFDVLYLYKNNQWCVANPEDYEKLGKCGYDMNVYLEFK